MSSFHIFLLFLIIIVPAGALAYKLMNGKKDLIEVECEILTLENNGEMSSSWRGKLRYYIDGKEYTYEIFSVYIETGNWDYMKVNFSSKAKWYSHLRDLKNRSMYDTGVDISSDDDILILQTCSKNKDYKKLL